MFLWSVSADCVRGLLNGSTPCWEYAVSEHYLTCLWCSMEIGTCHCFQCTNGHQFNESSGLCERKSDCSVLCHGLCVRSCVCVGSTCLWCFLVTFELVLRSAFVGQSESICNLWYRAFNFFNKLWFKKRTGFSFDLSQIFRKDCCCHSLTPNGGRAPWREMPVISRQIGLRHDRTSLDKKNPKKKWRRPTYGFLHLKSLVRPSWRTIM